MFKGHPKGLYILALANTGERFGYYTVVSVLLYYLQVKFGFDNVLAGQVIGIFMAFVYFMPLLGGWVADRWSFSKCVSLGLVVMGLGYLVISLPTPMRTAVSVDLLVVGMLLVGAGTGLFKSNLQVMIGDLYNGPAFESKRDAAFSIFYMAINVGAMAAPSMASYVNDLSLSAHGFVYNGLVADLANQVVGGKAEACSALAGAVAQSGMPMAGDVTVFAHEYIQALSTGYGYSFGVAFVSIVISYLIYLLGRGSYSHIIQDRHSRVDAAQSHAPELSPEQTRSRLVALFIIFGVVIFFWMVFMQNTVTLAEFAKSCTTPTPGGWTRIGFSFVALIVIAVGIYAAFNVFLSSSVRSKAISAAVVIGVIAYIIYYYCSTPDPLTNVQPQDYQQFNGFYIVVLTPFSLAFFGWLAKRGKEPSAPMKIAYGMLIAALAYIVLLIGSISIKGTSAAVSSDWLIATYLLLTVAELMLSPMGISFVSRVAPPKYKGAMMGCWFASTAIGTYLISIPMLMWGRIPIWCVWAILVGLCLLSAAFMFAIMRRIKF